MGWFICAQAATRAGRSRGRRSECALSRCVASSSRFALSLLRPVRRQEDQDGSHQGCRQAVIRGGACSCGARGGLERLAGPVMLDDVSITHTYRKTGKPCIAAWNGPLRAAVRLLELTPSSSLWLSVYLPLLASLQLAQPVNCCLLLFFLLRAGQALRHGGQEGRRRGGSQAGAVS